MTLDQMILDLQKRIGSSPEIEASNLVTWINQGYLAFCTTYDYTWLEQIAYGSTVENQASYTLPTDCKRLIELKIDDERYNYVPFEQRDIQTPGSKYYSVLNNKMIISPVPTVTGSADIEMVYYRRAEKMVAGSDTPDLIPEPYHEALVIYAFSIYNTYDEEHDEARQLMGSELKPNPGTFNWYVNLAKREEQRKKRGARRRFLSKAEASGYNTSTTTILGN